MRSNPVMLIHRKKGSPEGGRPRESGAKRRKNSSIYSPWLPRIIPLLPVSIGGDRTCFSHPHLSVAPICTLQGQTGPGVTAEGSSGSSSLEGPASAQSIPTTRKLQIHLQIPPLEVLGMTWSICSLVKGEKVELFQSLLSADLTMTQPGDLVNVQRKISLLFNIPHNVHPIQLVNRIMKCQCWKCRDNSI